ncbi:MAG TPA: T9SS type A sorting domain-containing protein [Cytophagaceae bacterium]|jgi:hypothetical protein|nr:T9SS type A sorting domain-containing protein [Cytophagaceae bacterium]
MKKIYLFLLLLPGLCSGQSTWTNTGWTSAYSLNDLAIGDEGYVYVASTNFDGSNYIPKITRSTDHGAFWTDATPTGLPASVSNICLAVKGTNMYLGADNGLYKSTDGGSTWASSSTGIDVNSTVNDIAIDDNNNVFATAVSFNSSNLKYTVTIYKSTNAGGNWNAVTTAGITNSGSDMQAYIAVKGSNMYLALASGIYKSTDGGSTWTSSTGYGGSIPQSISIDDNNHVYITTTAFDGTNYIPEVYASTNTGGSWNKLTTTGLPYGYAYSLLGRGGYMYFLAGTSVYAASDYTVATAIDQAAANNVATFYPNPASQTLYVAATVNHVALNNTLGITALEVKNVNSSVDVSAVEKGIYILQGFDVNNQLLFSEKLLISK